MAKGFVYFVQGVVTRLIKIGWTADVKRRLAALRLASPDQLILLGLIRTHREFEKLLHKKCKNICVHGEWFRATSQLESLIGRLLSRRGSIDVCKMLPQDFQPVDDFLVNDHLIEFLKKYLATRPGLPNGIVAVKFSELKSDASAYGGFRKKELVAALTKLGWRRTIYENQRWWTAGDGCRSTQK